MQPGQCLYHDTAHCVCFPSLRITVFHCLTSSVLKTIVTCTVPGFFGYVGWETKSGVYYSVLIGILSLH